MSHCSLTRKINWDLLIHTQVLPPSSPTLLQRSSWFDLPPQQHQIHPPLLKNSSTAPPPTHITCFHVCNQTLEDKWVKSITCCSFACADAREASIQMQLCISVLHLFAFCILACDDPELPRPPPPPTGVPLEVNSRRRPCLGSSS